MALVARTNRAKGTDQAFAGGGMDRDVVQRAREGDREA
jgi:hypothetical protein